MISYCFVDIGSRIIYLSNCEENSNLYIKNYDRFHVYLEIKLF